MPAAPAPTELLALLKQRLGIEPRGRQTGNTELARKLGWDTQYATQRMRDWEKSGAQPGYKETWDMLDALGWLQPERSAVDAIEEFVRRLDAGERTTAQERERVARQADRLQRDVGLLAARIRQGAQAGRKAR